MVRPPAPVRSRPMKKTEAAPSKAPPSRGGKPPSGAAAAAAAKKTEPRFSRFGAKDDKSNDKSKSAPVKGKEAKPEEKEEKIVEEEREERRFDPSGYDKDLVEMLGNNFLVD